MSRRRTPGPGRVNQLETTGKLVEALKLVEAVKTVEAVETGETVKCWYYSSC